MKPTGGEVADLIAGISNPQRQADARTCLALFSEVSGREAATWGSIIGFGSCHYRYPTGYEGDSPLLSFASRANATVVYLLDGVEAHDLTSLGKHRVGKGCLYLQRLDDVDLDALRRVLADSLATVTANKWEGAEVTVTG